MARFLSSEWFVELDQAHPDPVTPAAGSWVLEQVVTATPEGEVRYQVVVSDGALRIRTGTANPAMVTFSSDYSTAAAIAQGRLSTQAALLDGRVRVAGNLSGMAEALRELSGIDLVPAEVRATTTY
jgi:SCP-2 sterol transfer family